MTLFDIVMIVAALVAVGCVMVFLARRPGRGRQREISQLLDEARRPSIVRDAPPNSIFISYRRADSAHVSDRLHDHLVAAFGPRAVFKDVDSMLAGRDFRLQIEESLAQCKVFVCLIGPAWAGQGSDGRSRLADPDDFVRIEIETAIEREIPLIPVFIDGVTAWGSAPLPDSLRELVFRHGLPLRRDPDFKQDAARLVTSISSLLDATPARNKPR